VAWALGNGGGGGPRLAAAAVGAVDGTAEKAVDAAAEAAEPLVPGLTVAQPSGDRHLDRLGVGAIWQIAVLAKWLG
jgi:hypothetical protein